MLFPFMPQPSIHLPEQPELLSPAGGWDCLRAAVANGADAVYFGLPRFNARMRADNFRDDELAEVGCVLSPPRRKGVCRFQYAGFHG